MGTRSLRYAIFLLLCMPFLFSLAAGGKALHFRVSGAIGPATSDYLQRGLADAAARGASLVVISLDTPGGLDSAMREINQAILASPVPVVTYVSPAGARAASAGTYMLYASHVAAMAPGTSLGAATPVRIGGIPDAGDRSPAAPDEGREPKQAAGRSAMERKMVNDAVAYIRGLAALRNRNGDWAERAVREAESLHADQALEQKVVDVVAGDIPALLEKIHGREVRTGDTLKVLDTRDLVLERVAPDWRNRFLAVITDPNIAYILMLIGIYGLFFEFANPGYVLPGVAGAICLVLALYAFQVLPVNYAGVALIVLGIMFMIGEAFVPSFGALGLGGVIAFVMGSVILYEEGGLGYQVSLPLIGSLALVSAGFFVGVMAMVAKVRGQPVVSGQEEMLHSTGEAMDNFRDKGRIRVHGEVWWAESDMPVLAGQKVQVTAMNGLTLKVQPVEEGK